MNEELRKEVAVLLGLAETSTVDAVLAKVKDVLVANKTELARLQAEVDTVKLSAVTDMVTAAITAKKIALDKKEFFIEMGKKIGSEELSKVLEAMNPEVKITDVVNFKGENGGTGKAEYKKLSEVPENEIMDLRTNKPEEYAKLYKAEYGVECHVEV